MLHGYEEATIIPAMDLYDSGMMQQYIAAAREQYQQGQKDLDDFYKQYGDFLSPSQADMNYYYDNTVGRVRDALNRAYANGIDLTRSAEGRAYLANVLRSVPYGKLAAMRQNAKKLEAWQTLAAQMKANGTYGNDDFQRFVNGGVLPSDFSTLDSNGNIVMFENDAPTKFQTLNEATADWFKGRTPHELTKAQVEGMGMKYDPRYKYTGFDYNDLLKTAGSQTQGWESSPIGQWYYEQARKKVAAAGGNPDDKTKVQNQLNEDVAQANMRWLVSPTSKADEFAINADNDRREINRMTIKHNWDVADAATKHGYDMELAGLKSNGKTKKGGTVIGIDADGNPIYDTDIPPYGAAQKLDEDRNQKIKGLENRLSSAYDREWNTQVSAYKKLKNRTKTINGKTYSAQKLATIYGQAYRKLKRGATLNDLTNDERFAYNSVNNTKSGDPLATWRNAFKHRVNNGYDGTKADYVSRNVTIMSQKTEQDLYKEGQRLWAQNNQVATPQGEDKEDIDSSLGWKQTSNPKTGDQATYGKNVDGDVRVATITQVNTNRARGRNGNRTLYQPNGVVRTIDRAMRGAYIQQTAGMAASRSYGSTGNSTQVMEHAYIDLDDKYGRNQKVKDAVNKFSEKQLEQFGMKKDGDKLYLYIMTDVKGQRRASVNNRTRRREMTAKTQEQFVGKQQDENDTYDYE